jgi:hypothetical protein
MSLTEADLDHWERYGWLAKPGLVDAELLADLRRWVDEVAAWSLPGAEGQGLHHFEQTGAGPALARSERFADDHDGLSRFVGGELLGDVLAELYGEPAVLFKEKINYKHPGGAGFAPHQDASAYRFVDHHISVMVPVDPATEQSGCLWFAVGDEIGERRFTELLSTDGRGRILDEVATHLQWRPVAADPGDVVFFDSYAPHRSGTNTTDESRRVFYLTYNARSGGDNRLRYYADKEAEFERRGATFDDQRVRMSINDDFLGRPVEPGSELGEAIR